MKTIKTATIEINYEDEGPADAPVIVFSNSLGSNLGMWQQQAEQFRKDYRVVRYDHRGHGQSEVPEGPYIFAELSNDVVALMDALEIAQAHFVGLSMGGMTAMGLALAHPQRLLSITACNCVAAFGPEALAVWDERIAAITANGLAPLVEGTLQRWFTQPTIDARPDEMAAVREMILATPVAGYLACCEAIKHLNYIDRIYTIGVPTLFIAGTHDLGTPASAMRDMHARVSGSRYVELDAAHLSNIERPAEFERALKDFLSSI
jgi:3-oxoadipate enol-lactonase